jgi:site-specific DNA-adenine methylase
MLYSVIPKYTYTIQKINNIINSHNKFSQKDDYYNFRDYWNSKYIQNKFDESFIYETVLLLKMCSNSMIRFNKKGEFNQGFRGLGKQKEFFNDSMKNLCIDSLNNICNLLKSKSFQFTTNDFINIPRINFINQNNLLIFDPPYTIIKDEMYNKDFDNIHNKYLLDILSKTHSDFIYFNYLERDGIYNNLLEALIKHNDFTVLPINNKTASGQGRNKGSRETQEIIITNIK